MAEIITSDRAQRASGPGLSYALGAKLFGVPMYMAKHHGEYLKHAIEQRVFDAPAPSSDVRGSKFIGTFDQRSRFRVTDDGVAIVAIQGVLIDRGAFLGDVWGMMTSYEGLTEQIKRLADDSAISAVVLDIDSPGGMVAGLYDFGAVLAKLSKSKPVYALAANMAASAAYALACIADEVYVTRTGEAGSIGVIQIHQSYGRLLDTAGIDTTIICEPAPKANGNPFNDLSHGARAEMASGVSDAYQMFVDHVSKHRGLSADAVKATQARMFSGDQAVTAGLADGVKSIEDLLDHIRKGAKAARSKRKVPAARGATQNNGGGRMAKTAQSDEGTDFEAIMADSVNRLAKGFETLAAQAAPATPAAPVVVAAPAAAVAPVATAAPAAQDAHARIKAILDCEAAKERPGLAKFLALEKPDISAQAAEDILKVSPVEKAGGQASNFYAAVAANGGNPRVAHAAGDGGAALSPAQANIERQKARFSKKG